MKTAPTFKRSGLAKGERAQTVLFAADGKIGIAKHKKEFVDIPGLNHSSRLNKHN